MLTHSVAARSAALLVSLSVVACGPSEEVQRQLAELQVVSAQKDSLIQAVTENARLVSELSSEVARVQSPTATTGSEGRDAREQLLTDVRALTTRLEETERKLEESQQRIERLGRERADLNTQLAQVRTAMEDFQSTIESQRSTINALEAQLAEVREENTVLAAEKTALEDTLTTMTTEVNTVYYTVGTKDELIEKGLVTAEGGSRVLFVFGKRGETLVPARGLEPVAFTAIDMRDVREIQLPDPEAGYRIVTHQDLSALETAPDEDGKLFGTVRIADPERFWAGNPYLIIVRT